MVVATGPTVRQRQLGMRLRAIRAEKNLSVDAVAKELECSPSKISRLETATRRPNPRDVRDLCRFYGLDDATSAELVELAREAKEPGWWKQYPDVGLALIPYIGLEQDASAITSFAAFYVQALPQTADYARAIIKGIAPRVDPEVLRDRVEIRLRRQHPPAATVRRAIGCLLTRLCCTARQAVRRSWSRRLIRSSNSSKKTR